MNEAIEQFSEKLRQSGASKEDVTAWYWNLYEEYQTAKKKISILERGCACFRQWQKEDSN
tara:strand:+ start:1548 stop:1727 length:180 start_codon:yes stop_codon:yes gene_type:complete